MSSGASSTLTRSPVVHHGLHDPSTPLALFGDASFVAPPHRAGASRCPSASLCSWSPLSLRSPRRSWLGTGTRPSRGLLRSRTLPAARVHAELPDPTGGRRLPTPWLAKVEASNRVCRPRKTTTLPATPPPIREAEGDCRLSRLLLATTVTSRVKPPGCSLALHSQGTLCRESILRLSAKVRLL